MNTSRHPPSRRGRSHGWHAHPLGAPAALRAALADRGSLTRRLKACYPDFAVRPGFCGLAVPTRDEAALLGLQRGLRVYVREVLLTGGGGARVFAHSVVPAAALRGGWHSVAGLGARPLGEALFANPRVARRGLAFKRLDARHALFGRAQAHAAGSPRTLWARRSVFCLAGRPLLVSEIFLSELFLDAA